MRADTFERHRDHLQAVAYRMVGSVADAEDLVQEASLRWLALEDVEEIASVRAYLTTIVVRLCINHLDSARVRRERYVGPWLPEPMLTDTIEEPDPAVRKESLTMAFLVLLESLSSRERAVFLLRETFGMPYAEVARIVGVREAHCRQILRRAKLQIQARRPRFSVDREEQRELMERFQRATTDGDIEGLAALLAEDVAVVTDGGGEARAALRPVLGRDNAVRFIQGALQKFVPAERTSELREINGRPGLVAALHGEPLAAISADFADGRIQTLYIVTNPGKLKAGGLTRGGGRAHGS